MVAITPAQPVDTLESADVPAVAAQEVEKPAVVAQEVEEPAIVAQEVVEQAEPKLEETQPLVAKGYCVVMASAITHKGAALLIDKLAKEGFTNAVKHTDNGMLRVVLTGFPNEESARATMAVVRATDDMYSGSWIKKF
jgi:hypothetical protein